MTVVSKRQKIPSVNKGRHFGEGAVGDQKFVGVDDYLQLRDQDSVSSLVVRYSDHSVARRLRNRCVDEVARQAGYVCISWNSHFRWPPHEFFLSDEWPSCVHNVVQRKRNLSKLAPEKYALGGCSIGTLSLVGCI